MQFFFRILSYVAMGPLGKENIKMLSFFVLRLGLSYCLSSVLHTKIQFFNFFCGWIFL